MRRKDLSILIIILVALLLIAFVIWFSDRKIENIEMNMNARSARQLK
ncbi:MAG TPA: hypothetical protein VFQ73_06930 [Flavisolibacter sp.]|nr:hypothetical protein [Flavisolibacter sp.]